MHFNIDEKMFKYYNGKVKQIFLYLTDECQLRCKQCLYKPNLTFQMSRKEIPFELVKNLMSDFYEMGARKVTFMGGEPFLYNGSPSRLYELINFSYELGYSYTRVDSNGQNDPSVYLHPSLNQLGDLSFSIDGYSPETNDPLRGPGSFAKCVSSIDAAVSSGINVELTTCVHPMLLSVDQDELGLVKMIRFAESLNCNAINFHVLFKHGFPMDTWTGDDTANLPETWVRLRDQIEQTQHKIKIRIPTQFITKEEFDSNPEYYSYCPVKMGERALIHPDGQIRVCSGLIASKYCIGHYTDTDMKWEESLINETLDHQFGEATPCTNQSKCQSYGKYVPVCFSFKPYQKEVVWNKLLEWDKNKSNQD